MNAIHATSKMNRSTPDINALGERPAVDLTRHAKVAIAIYVVFPLVSAFISAMQGSGRTTDWPLGFRMAYYVPLALVVMWSSGLCCHALSRFTRFLQLPLWVLLIAGSLLAGEFIKLYVQMIVPIFDQLLPESATGGRSVEFSLETRLRSGLPTILTWVGLNLGAWIGFKVERFGYPPPSSKQPHPAAFEETENGAPIASNLQTLPSFAQKAGLTSVDQIEALEAQQHYIKIHGDGFEKVVLHRFSDAVLELSQVEGMQVHRSWWVRTRAIEDAVTTKTKFELKLKSGLVVPVSRTYQLKVSEALREDRVVSV